MAVENFRRPRSLVRLATLPHYVRHASLDEPGAAAMYRSEPAYDRDEYERTFMPDEITRDFAKRMHYAAHRAHTVRTPRQTARWMERYYHLRDAIVVGNRKLAYRAVRRRMADNPRTDDLIGDCHLVLIHAVAAYNPWLGVRFSTYAFTCLIRALSRISQRLANDRPAGALPIDLFTEGGPEWRDEDSSSAAFPRLDEFFRAAHPLLSDREKTVLCRRFRLDDRADTPTFEVVGRELGLSKERVRQVQVSALGKLREALLAGLGPS
jgi:RNA polymerase sigma factor (sigma-70 family)